MPSGTPKSPTRTSDEAEAGSGSAPARLAAAGVWARAPLTQLRLGNTRWSSNQPASTGLCSRIGCLVVGLMAPALVTGCPTSALTRVDLPAPVEPPHHCEQRSIEAAVPGQDVVIQLREGVSDVQPGRLRTGQGKRQQGRAEIPLHRFEQFNGKTPGGFRGGHSIIMPAQQEYETQARLRHDDRDTVWPIYNHANAGVAGTRHRHRHLLRTEIVVNSLDH